MGKVEDMRRQRELIYAQNERAAQARAAAASKAAAEVAPPAPPRGEPPADVAPAHAPAEPTEAAEAAEPEAGGERGAGKRAAPKRSAGKLSRPARAGRGGEEQGACSVCGKQRPLQGGMVSSHQKGFGKACPGSRQPPAAA